MKFRLIHVQASLCTVLLVISIQGFQIEKKAAGGSRQVAKAFIYIIAITAALSARALERSTPTLHRGMALTFISD